MAIHAAVHHVTHYKYDRPVTLGPQVVRLRPAPHCRTPILAYSLKIEPEGYFINWQQDPQSNHLARLVFPEKVKEFKITVDLVAEMAVFNPFDFFLEPHALTLPFAYEPWQRHELEPFLHPTDKVGDKFETFLASLNIKGENTVNYIVALNQRLQREIRYLIRPEAGVQTPEETLVKGSGSCRDSSWLLVTLLRRLGLAARFVSGYSIQLKPDVKALDGPSGTDRDIIDLHAWCEVYLPGAGWIGFDPTSGLLTGEGHIPFACTPEPSSASPITGGVDECKTEFGFEMTVQRIYESPRTTKPYTEEQWAAINALGRKLDRALLDADVRLTMGGEPTFISIDDMDGAEWNTAALGDTKRRLAETLFKKMWHEFAPGGVLHYGQGKWYPGEQLPRWAFTCWWRKDGQPIWRDPSLLADISRNYGFGTVEADKFSRRLAYVLGAGDRWLMPAYEDIYYHLWREKRLPANVDPLKSNLADPVERARLAKVFAEGLGTVKGYVLPLQRRATPGGGAWVSGPWFLRDETCYLIPGDSSLGYRLPLDSTAWARAMDHPYTGEPDPSAPSAPLPNRDQLERQLRVPGVAGGAASMAAHARHRHGHGQAAAETARDAEHDDSFHTARPPGQQESAAWVVRTALCVEPREGKLFVFLPPIAATADMLGLLAAIEDTASALGMPVLLEGYGIPHDPGLRNFRIAPDPGVIEVNIHPASSWEELVNTTEKIYDHARTSRLGTEKFMIDGRHTGTGGGNHLVIGGETPSNSPLLRRPDLLRSLIGYWHQHPSISYLFSSLFVGPTSQSPRVDEARHDSLYEMEIAFAELDREEERHGRVPPWLVDRIFRNLLTDVTGNTHRSELCIDKLYNPDSSTGRLGLLELRAFEMPPHARMSLAQQLLLRGLVEKFWREPYNPERLTRWGTTLHDKFMLPHFVKRDFADVIDDLRHGGWDFEHEWFAPHHEFRFPRAGDFAVRDIQFELRQALEPWNVLGEEGAPGGTVRYVDSSVERVQVKLQGLNGDRFALACNGRRVPLHSTGTQGEYVAGIRFRAWQPAACLHPTIGVDSPLTFDVVDTWNHRSLGGCTYHVAHPGGRNYATFPVNSYEAESRRLARFFKHGHTPGMWKLPPVETAPDFPVTLDLRRFG